MNAHDLRRVIRDARHMIDGVNSSPAQRMDIHKLHSPHVLLLHAKWMCDTILSWDVEEHREKAERWYGFIQGVIATLGLATVAELKTLNRSDHDV